MSRRKRTRAQRDASRLSQKADHEAKLAAWLAKPRPPAPHPSTRTFTARGGATLTVKVLPFRMPFDPDATEPPANLKELALAALTSKQGGDA